MFAASSNILAVFVGIFTVPFYIAYMLFTYRPTNMKNEPTTSKKSAVRALGFLSFVVFVVVVAQSHQLL